MIDRAVAGIWLGQGLKYQVSQWASDWLHPSEWRLPIAAVLAKHGLWLNAAGSLESAIYALRGKFSWDWDPLHGAVDYVKPPIRTLYERSGDCDDAAWLHAQIIEHALGSEGWKARIVSYLSKNFTLSHHFAVGIDPGGGVWPVQPPPASWQPAEIPYVWSYACKNILHAAREVSATYGEEASVVAYDVRDTAWHSVQAWAVPSSQA